MLALLEQFNGPNEAAVERLLDELAKGEAPPVAVESLGVEACAVTAEWEPGESQSPEAAPPVDCIFGATGVRDASGAWAFDLSLMAQAWADGSMPFHGIALRPLGPPNLAYGDPDISTTSQIAFAGADSAAGEPPQLVVELGRGGGDDPGFSSADTGGASFADVAAGSLDPSFVPPAGVTDVASPPVAAPTAGAPVPAPAGRSDPRTPWYVWATIPLALAGLAAFHQGLTAGAFGAGAVLRPGALARLVGSGRVGPGAGA